MCTLALCLPLPILCSTNRVAVLRLCAYSPWDTTAANTCDALPSSIARPSSTVSVVGAHNVVEGQNIYVAGEHNVVNGKEVLIAPGSSNNVVDNSAEVYINGYVCKL